MDSLQARYCGFMGYEQDTTPTMDSMAEEGIVFENALTPGARTPESMPVIFSGEFPIGGEGRSGLELQAEGTKQHLQRYGTIPEQFSDAGYTTVGFTTNGFTSRYFGYEAGFDHFEDFLSEENRPGPDLELPSAVKGLWKFFRNEEKFKRWEHYYDRIITQVSNVEEPFFLWVMMMDTHSPYLVPRKYREQNSWWKMFRANWSYWQNNFDEIPEKYHGDLVAAYDDSIRYADAFVSKLQNDLSGSDPIMIIHGDHGEEFGEHGRYGHFPQLYEENVHVPLLISNVEPPQRINEPMSLRELESVLSLLREGDINQLTSEFSREPRYVISKAEKDNKRMLRTSSWKLIRQSSESDELYNLASDPREKNNVISERGKAAQLLRSLLTHHENSQREKELIRDGATSLSVV